MLLRKEFKVWRVIVGNLNLSNGQNLNIFALNQIEVIYWLGFFVILFMIPEF